MADVVYFDSGINLPFCPPTVNGIYISGSGCCSEFYSAFIGGNQTYNLTYTLPTSSGTSGQVLTNDGNGNLSWTTVSGGGGGTGTLTGTGTTNYLSKWSSSTGLTNSIVLETGSTIDISGALRVTASSGTATSVMGRDVNGYVSNLLLGNGLSISGGTLSFTGSTGVSGNFVPYLGATGNTDLGGYGIAGSYFQLSTSTGGTLVPGMFSWNGTDGTADLMLKGGNVSLQIGQEQLARVINETGANLLESQYRVVRVNGSTGTRLKVALALASGDATSVETLGLVAENITLNQEGFVITSGLIKGINTTGSLQAETWSDGDMLFLSPYVAGALTNIKPEAPNHLVVMGYVVTAANNGSIYVKVDNGYELDELHNVLISSAATNNILAYDGVTGVWRNRTASSLNIASGSGTATQVAFWGGVTTLSGSSNLYWDNTNGSLGVRTSTPSARLHVVGSGTTTGTTFLVQNSGGTNLFNITDDGVVSIGTLANDTIIRIGASSNTQIYRNASTNALIFRNIFSATNIFRFETNSNLPNANISGDNIFLSLPIGFAPTSGVGTWTQLSMTPTINQTGGASGTTRGLYVNPTLTSAFDWRSIEWSNNTGYGLYGAGTANNYLAGNTSIGTITPSARLHVVGSGTTTGTTFLVQNSGGTNLFNITDNGTMSLKRTINAAGFYIDNAGEYMRGGASGNFSIGLVSAAFRGYFQINQNHESPNGDNWYFGYSTPASFSNTSTTGTNTFIGVQGQFRPTSGTAIYSQLTLYPTINQTGGASGTTRGLYVNPTLTSAFDWRSIEWSNNTGYGLYGAGTANNYLAGNTSIGTITPSARLHVVGSGNTSASTAFLVQNSSSNNMLSVLDNGNITIFGTGSTNLIWDSVGRLGIGSVVAPHSLHVAGSSRLRDITIGQLSNTTIANTSNLTFTFNGSTGVGIKVGGVLSATALLHIVGTGTTTGTTFLAQNSGGTETFRILDNGNVGINNASPIAKLYVKGETSGSGSTAFEVTDNTDRDIINVRDDGRITLGRNLASNVQSSVTIEAVGTETNIGIAIVPKGTGAITAAIPDGTTTGGNARGANSIDLQTSRSAVTQVAGGTGAVVIGQNNTGSGVNSVAIGINNNSSSSASIAIGSGNGSSAASSISIGSGNAATGSYSTALGRNSRSTLYGQLSKASGFFVVAGDSQTSQLSAFRSISGTTITELTLDGGVAAAGNRIILNLIGATNGRLWNAIVQLSAICTTAGGTVTVGESFIGTYNLGIKRIANATSLVGTVQNIIAAQADTNMSSSVVTITADDTTNNKSLKIEFTPPTGADANTVIRVVATVYLTEVGY